MKTDQVGETRAVAGRPITLNALVKQAVRQPCELVIVSCDKEIYLAEAIVNGEMFWVLDAKQNRLQTRSLAAMKRALAPVVHTQAHLKHQSTYDEMIGNRSVDQSASMTLPIVIHGRDVTVDQA